MQKMENLINESIKDRLVEVTSKPKRRRMKPQLVASTEDCKRKILGEIKALNKRAIERGEMQERLVPVLFLWGMPQKRLTKSEVQAYKNMGSRIEYLKETEVKSLKL